MFAIDRPFSAFSGTSFSMAFGTADLGAGTGRFSCLTR